MRTEHPHMRGRIYTPNLVRLGLVDLPGREDMALGRS